MKGDLDLDGIAINANSVVLNGGSIRDGAGNDAVLTHSAVAENSDYIVDGVPATVRSVAITSNPGSDNTYGVGDTIEVTVTFSESVRVPRRIGSGGVVRMPLLELNVGGVAKIARTHEGSTITGTTVVFFLHGPGWRQRRGRHLHRRQQAHHAEQRWHHRQLQRLLSRRQRCRSAPQRRCRERETQGSHSHATFQV